MTRREAREAAFCLLFEYDFNSEKTLDDIIGTALEERGAMTDEFSRGVLEYSVSHLEEIDAKINACIIGRSASRVTKAGRAVMRIAAAEMLMGETPVAVIINEAVDLAKKYDGDEMPGYINGVLGTLSKNLEKERS